MGGVVPTPNVDLGRRDGVPFAVVGDPDGDRIVEAPDSQKAMRVLQREVEDAGERFYCARSVGGCGHRVTVVAGTERHPHFRHLPGSRCSLTDEREARDRYTHRLIQLELVRWLRYLRFDARPEHYVARRSRVDVFCSPKAVIEVQLSGETAYSMEARTTRYGGSVTWLFGPGGHITSRDTVLAEAGVVQLVRLRPDRDAERPGTLTGRRVDIGVQTLAGPGRDGGVVWFPLVDCVFDPVTGLAAPTYSAEVDRVRADREADAAAEEVARLAAEEQEQRLRAAAAEWAARRMRLGRSPGCPAPPPPQRDVEVAELKPRPVPSTGAPGRRPTVFTMGDLHRWETQHDRRAEHPGRWQNVITLHADIYPWWCSWVDGRWTELLPEVLVEPAWAALFTTCTIYSDQVSKLIDPLIDPDHVIAKHMVRLGLIEVCGGSGYLKYTRLHDLAGIWTGQEWHQPPARAAQRPPDHQTETSTARRALHEASPAGGATMAR